jgi:ABC-type dipeptide/oligopeptide/nickel transport system permease component
MFVVSIVTFALGRYAPSDYVDVAVGTGRRNPEAIERIKEERGLNDPVYEQYVRYMGKFVRGDFGQSVRYRGADIEDVILPKLWITIQYNVVVLMLTFAIGLPVGVLAAVNRGNWLDPVSIGGFLVFASVPVIVTVPLAQLIFVIWLDWLPSGGWESRDVLGVNLGVLNTQAILPVLVLTLPGVAGLARYMRAQIVDVLAQDYIRTARAKGLRENVVVLRHVVRNALLPIATLLGFELAALVSGSIIVETLLGIPGIGNFAFESVTSRDYDSIMAVVLLGSAVFMIAMLAVDISYGFIDPRIRLTDQRS